MILNFPYCIYSENDPVPVIGGVIGAVLALLVIGIIVVSWRRQAM
jgi:hypothetical protein